MQWLRQLLDWQNEVEDPGEFLDSLRFEINSAEVFVFTPRGDVIGLPIGSTPVDFAYAIHTEVGHHTIGARVNGRLVPLESELEHGDVVEVFTSKSPNAGPTRDWLTFVKSPRARSKIRHWFTKERREEAIEQGKEQIGRLLRKEGLPLKRVMTHESLTQVANELRVADVSALYAAVGEGNLGAQTVVRKVIEVSGGDEGAAEDLAEAVTITRPRRRRPRGARLRRSWSRAPPTCWSSSPAAVRRCRATRSSASSPAATASRCTAATAPTPRQLLSQPERLAEVEWAPTSQSTFLVQIMVEALDRARLLSDITMVLSDQHVNILSASLTTNRDRVAKSRFAFEMGDPKHLGAILKAVRQVDGVFDAYRVTARSPARRRSRRRALWWHVRRVEAVGRVKSRPALS